LKRLFITFIISIFFLTNCTRLSDGPKNTYYEFEEFCAEGDLSAATLLVTQQGIDENKKYDVCVLTPNNYFKLFETGQYSLDDPNPTVEIHGGIALLSWRTSDTKIVMIMDKIDGIWKIRTTLVDPEAIIN
jgi:hypothetical protein